MKNVANIQNDGNLKGGYPLFLGEDLGFADTTTVTYPDIEEWYQDQLSQFWRPEEFSLIQDKVDLRECSVSERDVMIKNLMAQWLLDSVAARSILETIGPFTSNTEMLSALTAWTFFEDIHARSYSLIIRQCFDDPNEVIESGKADLDVAYRSAAIGREFNRINQLAAKYNAGEDISEKEIRKQLLKIFAAIYALEAVSFMASFACTFALAETGRFQGISNIVTAICKDEVLHARLDRTVLDAMLNKEGYADEMDEVKDDIKYIFDEVVRQEFRWAEYVFEEGRKVIGLNTSLLQDYTRYVAYPMYRRLGIHWDKEEFGEAPTKDPLPFMQKYVSPDSIQAAAQEIEITNYRIASVDNDVSDDEEFDF